MEAFDNIRYNAEAELYPTVISTKKKETIFFLNIINFRTEKINHTFNFFRK